jgi:SNF2 family DNA or RNA helicase
MDEIRYHAEESAFPKIMHYRAKNKIPRAVLEDLDVVVTSYNEVMRQFPFPNHKDRVEIGKMGYNEWWKKVVESQLGDLHSIHWYRVVLDEAQAIKNNSARTSLACQALKSVYRWCLTGTPLLNRLEE